MRTRERTSCCTRTDRRARPRSGTTTKSSGHCRAPNDGAAARKTLGGSPPFPVSLPGVTDVHVHLEPYRELKPAVLEGMERETPGFEGLARATAAAGGLLEGLAAP